MVSVPAAEVDIWTPIGPSRIDASSEHSTGVLFHIAIPAADPNTIYVSSPTSGVWASADRGASWRDATGDLPLLTVVALAVDPANPQHILPHWATRASMPRSMAVAPGHGSARRRVACPRSRNAFSTRPTRKNLYMRASAAIHRSTNGGTSWQVSRAGISSHLILAPGNPRTLYAGVPNVGVARTVDGGASWAVLTPGLAPTAFDVRVAPSPADPRVIYARNRVPAPTLNEIWRSADGGGTWTKQSTPNAFLSLIKADATIASRVYSAGVDFFRSDDGGATWAVKPGPHADHHDCIHDPGTPADIYTACDGGLYRATQAENWAFVADGIANVEFYDLAVAAGQPELAIGGTQDNGTLISHGLGLECGRFQAATAPPSRSTRRARRSCTSWTNRRRASRGLTMAAPRSPTSAAGCRPARCATTCASGWTRTTRDGSSPVAARSGVRRCRQWHGHSSSCRPALHPRRSTALPSRAMALTTSAPARAASMSVAETAASNSVLCTQTPTPSSTWLSTRMMRHSSSMRLLAGATHASTAFGAHRPSPAHPPCSHRPRSPPGFRPQRLPSADRRARRQHARVQPTTGLLRAATFGRSAYQVQTDAPVGSTLNTSGHITFLRVHDVGTGFGQAPNVLDGEVVCLLDTVPSLTLGFQLRLDAARATRREMLALLRAAFVSGRRVSIDYVRTAPRVGTVIRVARIER